MKLAVVFASLFVTTSLAAAEPPPAPGPRPPLKQLLLDRFDRNQDGRLEPRERRQAAHALRKLARKLARADRADRADRAHLRRRIIQRYDLDGDGNVGPAEMPPGVARRLQRLDRN